MAILKLISTAACGALLLTACSKPSDSSEASGGPAKVRVGYIGLTCEAPIFTAVEKGFFKEEGLDVSLVKCEWANYKDVLALGGFDVTHHLVMYFLKPIEQGLDVKFTGGIHRGCLRVQAAAKGNIRTIKDLRANESACRAWEHRRSSSPIACSAPTGSIRAKKSPGWCFPPANWAWPWTKAKSMRSLIPSRSAACCVAQGKVRNIADQAADVPYSDEYCCAVLVNGKFLARESQGVRRGARALCSRPPNGWRRIPRPRRNFRSRESTWLRPRIRTPLPFHTCATCRAFRARRRRLRLAAAEMKTAGMLSPTTDVDELGEARFRASGRSDG